jgi:hypothetical protein
VREQDAALNDFPITQNRAYPQLRGELQAYRHFVKNFLYTCLAWKALFAVRRFEFALAPLPVFEVRD